MTQQQLATYAALITEVLKRGNSITPKEAINLILITTPEGFELDDLIQVLYNIAHELQIDYKDYYDLIGKLLDKFTDVPTDSKWNTTCATIAQVAYVALSIAKSLPIPGKWKDVIQLVLSAYEGIKK
jgi:hypothetical protein